MTKLLGKKVSLSTHKAGRRKRDAAPDPTADALAEIDRQVAELINKPPASPAKIAGFKRLFGRTH